MESSATDLFWVELCCFVSSGPVFVTVSSQLMRKWQQVSNDTNNSIYISRVSLLIVHNVYVSAKKIKIKKENQNRSNRDGTIFWLKADVSFVDVHASTLCSFQSY